MNLKQKIIYISLENFEKEERHTTTSKSLKDEERLKMRFDYVT